MNAESQGDPLLDRLRVLVPWANLSEHWFAQTLGTKGWPTQGWKLHLSVTTDAVVALANLVVPPLLESGQRFKIARDLRTVDALNSGDLGVTQIGKIVTIYPSNESCAVDLARELDRITSGLRGPVVPTDRRLNPTSCIYYRYGAFREPSPGEYLDVDGRLAADHRTPNFYLPRGRTDPFDEEGLYQAPSRRRGFFADRYIVAKQMARSARGGTFEAYDLKDSPPSKVVIKEFLACIPSSNWIENETNVLRCLPITSNFPALRDTFDHNENRYIVTDHFEGSDLPSIIANQHLSSWKEILDFVKHVGSDIGQQLTELHAAGFVHRDVKQANIIGSLVYRLVDFGITGKIGDPNPILGGTPGYMSPQQEANDPPTPADDQFSWGALLLSIVADSFNIPAHLDKHAKLRALNGLVSPSMLDVIDRAMAASPLQRFESIDRAVQALIAVSGARVTRSNAVLSTDVRKGEDLVACLAQELSAGIDRWSLQKGTLHEPDLYDGLAGPALFLLEAGRFLDESQYLEIAREVGVRLCGDRWGMGRALPGLYVGESGIGMLLVRLARVLREPGWLKAATLRAQRLRGSEHRTVDLLYGSAGELVLLAELSSEGEGWATDRAIEVADNLMEASVRLGEGLVWEVGDPSGFCTPQVYFGFAHGCSGIAAALLRTYEVTGYQRCRTYAESIGNMLCGIALAEKGQPVSWPRHRGGSAQSLQAWCHGGGGIGVFLAKLATFGSASAREFAHRAATTVASESGKRRTKNLCHGRAGDLWVVDTIARLLQDPGLQSHAKRISELVAIDLDEELAGQLSTSGDGLFTGRTGLGLSLIRHFDSGPPSVWVT